MTSKKRKRADDVFGSRAIATCGPYKGYYGRAEWDSDAGFFHGEVIGARDVITFVGKTIPELEKELETSIDFYLEMCGKHGTEPEKPFSGKFLARIKPEVHRELSVLAERSGQSFNQLVAAALEQLAASAREQPAKRFRNPASDKLGPGSNRAAAKTAAQAQAGTGRVRGKGRSASLAEKKVAKH